MSADSPELTAGAMVGEYVIEGVLGRGGMSVLYTARHPVIGKRAVVKIPSHEPAHQALAIERFVREARAVNLIRHPNVVDIFGFGVLGDGRHYLVMEHLEGESLQARQRRFRFSRAEVLEVVLQLSDVLDAAHALGVLHLDLKPDNVYLIPVRGNRTLVKVLDFGLAVQLDEPDTRTPRSSGFSGTPEYASPEQAEARVAVGPAGDVYALGVIAYELFTGRRPFVADTVQEMLQKHVSESPPRPRSIAEAVTPEEELLVLDMMSKDPAARPPAADVRERVLALRSSTLRASTQVMPRVVALP